jgi:hypothetical protein
VPSEGRKERTVGSSLSPAVNQMDGISTALVLHRHMGKESSPRRLFTWLLGFIDTDGVSDR